jgi:hypothetical protein
MKNNRVAQGIIKWLCKCSGYKETKNSYPIVKRNIIYRENNNANRA